MPAPITHPNQKMIKAGIILFGMLYLLSLFLPVLYQVDNHRYTTTLETEKVIYGYQCFGYAKILLFLSLVEGHGDLQYSFLGLLLGCFANLYLLTHLLFAIVRKPPMKFPVHPLMPPITLASISYWFFFDKQTLQMGYHLWALSSVALSILVVIHHKIRRPLHYSFKS